MSSQELKQYYAELAPWHSAAGEVALYYDEMPRYAAELPLRQADGEVQLIWILKREYDFSCPSDQDRLIRDINWILRVHPYLAERHEDSLEEVWNSYRRGGPVPNCYKKFC